MYSLTEIAENALKERGFITDFSDAVLREVQSISTTAPPSLKSPIRDMRKHQWISIDNEDSKDLDQLTFSEKNANGQYRIFVAIADVATLVRKDTALDNHAKHNTTSLYTPTKIFPMLPNKLSTNLTSLNEREDRCAIIVEMEIDIEGKSKLIDLSQGLVKNHAKLTYNEVAALLDQNIPLSHPSIAEEEIKKQLQMQDFLAKRMKEYRSKQGALSFAIVEILPIVQNDIAIDLKVKSYNRAHNLIANFMLAANAAFSFYLDQKKLPQLKRVVREPKRWDRIVYLANELGQKLPSKPNSKALRDFLFNEKHIHPDRFHDLSLAIIKLIGRGEYVLGSTQSPDQGHFDLALTGYTHGTAPNRRFPDLILQRLLKDHFHNEKLSYKEEELIAIASHCTQKEDDAAKAERRIHKSAAAMVLEPRIGESFKAMVTGSGIKGTWVRLVTPPIEGKLIEGFQGVDVGDYLTVRLSHVDILRGHIDFIRN